MNAEVWLPVYTELHVSGRLLFIRAKENQIERYSDYKKFTTDTRILPADPN